VNPKEHEKLTCASAIGRIVPIRRGQVQNESSLQPGQPSCLEQKRERPGDTSRRTLVAGQLEEPLRSQASQTVRRRGRVRVANPVRVPAGLVPEVLDGGEGQKLRRVPGVRSQCLNQAPSRSPAIRKRGRSSPWSGSVDR
jgi:hypothetical protein